MRVAELAQSQPYFSPACCSPLGARAQHFLFSWSAFPSSAFSPRAFLRGEKVPKADEGGKIRKAIQPRPRPNYLKTRHMHGWRTRSIAPSSGFATFSPTKSVGEKALDWKVAMRGWGKGG